MPVLRHSPADVLAKLIAQLGHGTVPTSSPGEWPVYAGAVPDQPDQAMVVRDTTGVVQARLMPTGEVAEHPGWQLTVRSRTYPAGWLKAYSVRTALAESVRNLTVELGDRAYLVYAVTGFGAVLSIGRDRPSSGRHMFTVNGTLDLRDVT